MNILKGIDVFLQSFLVLILLAGLMINNEDTMSPAEYLVALGAVQLISIVAHFFISGKEWKKLLWRKVHHIGTLLIILAVVIILNVEKPAGVKMPTTD